jgi:prophage DNA circulation protein
MTEIYFNGITLSRSDFEDTLEDRIAFDIAFTAGVYCRDKEAALELLRDTAAEIVERCQSKEKSNLSDVYAHPRVQAINSEVEAVMDRLSGLIGEVQEISRTITGEEWSVGVNGANRLMIRRPDTGYSHD